MKKKVKNTYKLAIKTAKEKKDAKSVSVAFKAIDKASKKSMMHKNKAARMKSALSKLVGGSASNAAEVKTKSTTEAKPSAQKTSASKPTVKKTTVKQSVAKATKKKTSAKTSK